MANRNKVIPSYFGSKNVNGLYQFIINRIPKHSIYVEGFLGGGTILQMKSQVARNIAYEIDTNVCTAWQHRCNEYNLELLQQSFVTGFQVLAKKIPLPLTFVYLDPPYMHSTRTSSHRYKHEMTINDHEQLLSLVHTVKTNYMISCYDNELYSTMLQGWRKETCNSMTRAGVRVETIYMNYPAPAVIADLNYVGSDFTDRQRIKRKVSREIEKLKRIPATDRAAIIDAIRKEFKIGS